MMITGKDLQDSKMTCKMTNLQVEVDQQKDFTKTLE